MLRQFWISTARCYHQTCPSLGMSRHSSHTATCGAWRVVQIQKLDTEVSAQHPIPLQASDDARTPVAPTRQDAPATLTAVPFAQHPPTGSTQLAHSTAWGPGRLGLIADRATLHFWLTICSGGCCRQHPFCTAIRLPKIVVFILGSHRGALVVGDQGVADLIELLLPSVYFTFHFSLSFLL